jgi:hypothetical protein
MRFLCLLLCPVTFLNQVWAQTNTTGSKNSGAEAALHVRVVDEPGPVPTQSTPGKGYVVQVTNSLGAPVSGAAVALRLPEDGPTGRFSNGLRAWVAYTDAAGIARFPAIQWGDHAGVADLRLTAAKGSAHSGVMVAQQIGPENPTVSVVAVPMETAPPVVPKPAAPRLPELALETPTPGTGSKPLADTVAPPPSTMDLTGIAVPAANAPSMNVSRSGTSAPTDKPHSLTPNPPQAAASSAPPQVTITNSPTGAGGATHEGHKKMWVLVAVGTGAGLASLLALHAHLGGGGAGGTSSAGVTVGTPTIVVSH